MNREDSPLLEPRDVPAGRRAVSRRLIGASLMLSAASVLLLSNAGRHSSAGDKNVELLAKVKGPTILYQDWRGMSLEQQDAFSFSHTWTGDLKVESSEEHIVQPPSIKYLTTANTAVAGTAAAGVQGPGGKASAFAVPAIASISSSATDARSKAAKLFMVVLDGAWEPEEAEGLVQAFETVCGDKLHIAKNGCGLSHSVWTVSQDRIVDDISVSGEKVTVSKLALANAKAKDVDFDGKKGKLRSKRLQHAVMRFVSSWGHKPEVVDHVLGRMFGATLNVDLGYTKLTQDTTIEDGARFMKFKPRELMLCLEAWSDMPENMHKVAGLRYLTRRQQGLNHPLYGRTTAVSWPTNMDKSYQEYMDYSFNADAYTSRHLFIHEKSHFFWGRQWTDALKQEWEGLGGWEKEEGTAHGWVTKKSTPFTSGYGSRNSPDEDMAESMAAYVLHPSLLQARSKDKYNFFVSKLMSGVRFVENPEVPFTVENKNPYYRLPAQVKHVSISVEGGPADDKKVTVEMLLDPGKGWHSPNHVEVQLSGPNSGSHTLTLTKKDGYTPAAGEDTIMMYSESTMSKYYENGFWSAKQIKVTDDLSNTRWMMVDAYSWRLYLNNIHGTTWAPRYLANTLKLAVTGEMDPVSKQVIPTFTATARFQQTGAPMGEGDKVPIWMRLAAHRANGASGITDEEWRSNGAGGSTYPLYHEGTCVKDSEHGYDGTCTVKFELSPTWPAGQYYISMLTLQDIAGNERAQFFSKQPAGIVCCGRVGNQGDDEYPTFVKLDECAKGVKPSLLHPCVTPDLVDPELDLSSVKAVMQPKAGSQDGEGEVVLNFKARDVGGSGIGTISYRIMDPQGFSHFAYLVHDNSYTTVYSGDPTEWKDFEARLALAKGSPPGEWRVESIELHDKASNRKNFQLIELLVFEPA